MGGGEQDFLAEYDLERVIGRGSYAAVWLGQNRQTMEKVAVKVVERAQIRPNEERHLRKELEIAKRVPQHPNIVSVYDVIETAQKFYVVMELARGGELFDRIVVKGHFSEAEAKAIIRNITHAIEHLHSMNIAHRDLKPENLLEKTSSDDIHVLVADFGLACVVGEEDLIKETCGSPGYMAPEALTRECFGMEADMWSLGVITYILLCGYPPFHDDQGRVDVICKLTKKGKYDYTPAHCWQQVSALARDFIDHLLVVDYRKRFTAKQALAHEWLAEHNAEHGKRIKITDLTHKLAGYLHLRRSTGSGHTTHDQHSG